MTPKRPNPQKIAKKQPSPNPDVHAYEVNPANLYPEMLEYISAALTSPVEDAVKGLNTAGKSAIRTYYSRANLLPPKAWEIATYTRQQLTHTNVAQRIARAWPIDVQVLLTMRRQALETSRLWFTELLHESLAHRSLTIHITKDDHWRL